jgi:hypothetical protein
MTPPAGGSPIAIAHSETGVRYAERLKVSVLIGLCCLVVYNANMRSISAGDTYPARYLPFAIVQYHTIFLDPVAKVAAQGRGDGAFWMLHRPSGHIISLYPVVVPVLIAPLYVPAVVYLHFRGWSDARLDYLARLMEKLSASLLAALSASLLYLLLRRRTNTQVALLLTLAYAFGTTTWMISSQALWQHGMAELLVIGTLLFLTAPCTVPRTLAAGLLLGLIAGNRPPDALLAAALGVYGLFWAGRRRAVLLTAAAALPGVLVLLYNLHVAGNIGGGYGLIGSPTYFEKPLFPGIAGLLISPTHGLLIFSPFLIFLLLAWRYRPADRAELRLMLVIVVTVAIQILIYAKTDWRGGLSWGPRYMTDVLPFLMWMLVPVVAALRGPARHCFRLTVVLAVAIEAIGAFAYTGPTDLAIYTIARGPLKMQAAWNWRNAPYLTAPRKGVAPADLAVEVRGNLDALEAGGRATSAINAGQQVFAKGWALAGRKTPAQVAIIVDGRQTFATSTFADRPDVQRTLSEPAPAGWQIAIDTASLAPGTHLLALFAWVSEKGEGAYLGERMLMVRKASRGDDHAAAALADIRSDLVEASRRAATRLREHQQPDGYWLTAYTSGTSFHEPRQEMNTFLTALLVDLLNPLAGANGLENSLQHARQHLTRQIESGGLVRYHGLPDGPGIGTLGCVITPDTDDTALVWRLAPAGDRRRLTAALATMDRYRTREGLYRSWLAPREAYQCLDPGNDPNPADIAIQMHLLLLLSGVRPPAAHALCEALRPAIDEDHLWVYYRKTPLVPILRLTDLRLAGCDLTLPEARMRTEVPGQQIWVSVAQVVGGQTPAGAISSRAILRELARDDFALIRTNPPLLYHNDLTATVTRYYWSEDAGYALWLRLYYEYERLGRPHPAG